MWFLLFFSIKRFQNKFLENCQDTSTKTSLFPVRNRHALWASRHPEGESFAISRMQIEFGDNGFIEIADGMSFLAPLCCKRAAGIRDGTMSRGH